MNFTFFTIKFIAIFIANIKYSYSTLLFYHEKFNLKEYGIGTPYGVTNTTLAPPLYLHQESSK